jgi:hypothetical protein
MFPTQQFVLMVRYVRLVQGLKPNKDVQMDIIVHLKLQKMLDMTTDVKLDSFAELERASRVEQVISAKQVTSAHQAQDCTTTLSKRMYTK